MGQQQNGTINSHLNAQRVYARIAARYMTPRNRWCRAQGVVHPDGPSRRNFCYLSCCSTNSNRRTWTAYDVRERVRPFCSIATSAFIHVYTWSEVFERTYYG